MKDRITKDSGVRASYSTGMQRDTNAGKARFDLTVPNNIPYKEQLLTRFAELMQRGAVKYCESKEETLKEEFIQLLIEEVLCQNVENIQIERYTQKDTVGLAMKKDFEVITQSSQKDKEKIELIGGDEILRKLKNFKEEEIQILSAKKETKTHNESEHLEESVSPKRRIYFFWKNKKISALSAESLLQSFQSILIMTIQRGLQEDIFVMGATEDLVCLETALKVLQEQLDIFKNLQLQNSLIQNSLTLIWKSERNWEKAKTQEEMNRYKDSAFRHFMQWYCGEDDEDHAVAVLFNIMGYETTKYKFNNAV